VYVVNPTRVSSSSVAADRAFIGSASHAITAATANTPVTMHSVIVCAVPAASADPVIPAASTHRLARLCDEEKQSRLRVTRSREESMKPTDITIEILKSIRDELHDGLTGVRADLAGVTERMDRLEPRQTEADLRIATQLVAIAGAVRETRDAYREDRALSHRVDDHARRLSDVEKRVGV